MNTWLIASLLLASVTGDPETLPQYEIGANASAFTSGYAYRGGFLGELFLAPGLDATVRAPRRGLWTDRLLLEGAVSGLLPVSVEGAAAGFGSVLRLGAEFKRVTFTGGAYLRVDGTPNHMLLLPSLSLVVRIAEVSLHGGVLDRPVGAIARVGASWRGLGLAYLFPFGGEAFARLSIARNLATDLRVYGFKVLSAFQVGASVGIAYALPGSDRSGGGR